MQNDNQERKSSQRRHMSSQLHHGEKCHPLTAERPCLEEKAQGVKGLEHQWKRPPATHTNKWNNCLLPACGAFMAKGCLILMASSHGALYSSIRNKEPPQLPPPPSSYPAQPCCGRTWWGIEHFCIWYHISQKVNGEYFKEYVKL